MRVPLLHVLFLGVDDPGLDLGGCLLRSLLRGYRLAEPVISIPPLIMIGAKATRPVLELPVAKESGPNDMRHTSLDRNMANAHPTVLPLVLDYRDAAVIGVKAVQATQEILVALHHVAGESSTFDKTSVK